MMNSDGRWLKLHPFRHQLLSDNAPSCLLRSATAATFDRCQQLSKRVKLSADNYMGIALQSNKKGRNSIRQVEHGKTFAADGGVARRSRVLRVCLAMPVNHCVLFQFENHWFVYRDRSRDAWYWSHSTCLSQHRFTSHCVRCSCSTSQHNDAPHCFYIVFCVNSIRSPAHVHCTNDSPDSTRMTIKFISSSQIADSGCGPHMHELECVRRCRLVPPLTTHKY